MTWKEIKQKIESLGVKDDDRISYIDIDSWGFIEASFKDGGWNIG